MGNGAGTVPGADPRFPVGGRDDTPGGANIRLILPNFSKKKKEIENILGRGDGGHRGLATYYLAKTALK